MADVAQAQVNGTPHQDRVTMTTDDLILMVGEKVVECRYQAKVIERQQAEIARLSQELLAVQSRGKSVETEHQNALAAMRAELEKATAARHGYIVQLENQVQSLRTELEGLRKTNDTLSRELAMYKKELAQAAEKVHELEAGRAELERLKEENARLAEELARLASEPNRKGRGLFKR